MDALCQNDSSRIAEAFSQSDIIPLVSKPGHPSSQGYFRKVQIS
jgi:hypothetical protein